jgi:uncharacterized cupin superfamily protein
MRAIPSSTPAIAPASNERDGHHVQNRGEATALILEVGTRGPAEPHAEYPDIDLRVNAQGYVHKDGTPYS